LYPGFPIGQLILLENGRLADETRPLSAAYVGPIEPETPALKHPKNVLRQMGIQRYRNPHFTDWRGTNE
jgi:hypothetical protein